MKQTAADGTVFAIYNQDNGDYVAMEDDEGFHHAPAPYSFLPTWSYRQKVRALADAVSGYEHECEQESALDNAPGGAVCGQCGSPECARAWNPNDLCDA
jgi:hypothetical protein